MGFLFLVLSLILLIGCTADTGEEQLETAAGQSVHSPMPTHNVVLILADDVGVEAFTVYGGTEYATPNIERLAQMGTTYLRAFSQPLCTPSRAELMTGKENQQNYESFGWLDPDETTFAEQLRSSGYRTAVAGKWQLSAPESDVSKPHVVKAPDITPAIMREEYGFEKYSLWQLNNGLLSGQLGSRYWAPQLEQDGDIIDVTGDDYGPDLHTRFLLSFIETAVRDEAPFLAYFPTALPHDPWVSTPDSTDTANRTDSDPAYFGDNIEYLDSLLGRIIDRLTDLKILDETLIVFVGDNGTSPDIRTDTNAGEIRGNKGVLSLRATHVPLLVAGPGIPVGEKNDEIVRMRHIHDLVVNTGSESPRQFFFYDVGISAGDKTGLFHHFAYDAKGKSFPTSAWILHDVFRLYDDGRFTIEETAPDCCIRFERDIDPEEYPDTYSRMRDEWESYSGVRDPADKVTQ